MAENVAADAQTLSSLVAKSQGAEGSLQAQQATMQRTQWRQVAIADPRARRDPRLEHVGTQRDGKRRFQEVVRGFCRQVGGERVEATCPLVPGRLRAAKYVLEDRHYWTVTRVRT